MTPLNVLRWSIAAVMGLGALALLVHLQRGGAVHAPTALALPLAITEMIAAALFLLRRTLVIGGLALALVALTAFAAHIAIGERPPIELPIYAVAIWAIIRDFRRRNDEVVLNSGFQSR
jgi:hypothetical protein